MELIMVFLFIGAHWLCDFVLQTDAQAKGKSTCNKVLADHVFTYATFMTLILGLYIYWTRDYIDFENCGLFLVITWVCHFTTDYCTSRLNSYLWKKGDVHNFFVSIGFDQVLHYVQIFLTYKILFL